MFGKLFAGFFLVKFNIDVVVFVLRGHEIRKYLLPLLVLSEGAPFRSFVLSLQTPMYENGENKNNGNFRMQNVTGNETLAAPMYEKKSNFIVPSCTYCDLFRLVQI